MEPSEVLHFASESILLSILFILLLNYTGSFISNKIFSDEDLGTKSQGAIFFGIIPIGFLLACKTVGVLNSLTIPMIVLCIGMLHHFFKNSSTLQPLKNIFYEIIFVVFNIILRFITFYDLKNKSFLTEYKDTYVYVDQLFYLEKYGIETSYPQMESLSTGQSFSINIYHYLEYYLAVFFKIFISRPNYQILFFCALPLIISICQILIFRYIRYNSKIKSLYICLAILSITTLHRFFHFGLPIEIFTDKISWFFQFYYFPIFKITSTFWSYLYNFYPKIPVLLLLFFGIFLCTKTKNIYYNFIIILFSIYTNIVFFPFLLIFYYLIIYSERRHTVYFTVPIFSIILVYLSTKILNINHVATNTYFLFPTFNYSFSVKETYRIIFDKFFFLFGNFYPHILLLASIRLVKKRSYFNLIFILLILIFPIIFIFPTVTIKIYFLSIICISLFFLYNNRDNLFKNIFYSGLYLANICLWMLDIWTHSIVDIFQIHQMSLVGSIYLLLLYYSITSFKDFSNTLIVIFSIFLIVNFLAINFYFKRTYYKEKSSNAFNSELKKRTNNRMMNAVYISIIEEMPYFGLGNVGGDFKNVSDSLISHFISIDALTKKDSMKLISTYAWKIYQDKPVVQFYNKHKQTGRSVQEIQRMFLLENNIKVIIKKDGINRSKMDFSNLLLQDSLYNSAEYYWVYFLK